MCVSVEALRQRGSPGLGIIRGSQTQKAELADCHGAVTARGN